MTEEMTVNYDQLVTELAHFLGWPGDSLDSGETASIQRFIRSGLNRFYHPPGYTWSFMEPESTITTVEPYDTGTVTIVDGVVTLATGTWPSWAAGAMFCVDLSYYVVVSRDNDNQVTLDDLTVDKNVGTTYTLGRYVYDLPADFSRFDGYLRNRSQGYEMWPDVAHVTAESAREQITHALSIDYPQVVGVRPKTFDPTVGQRYQAVFHPVPDGAYTFWYTYRVAPSMLTIANKYPLGGAEHSETILEACLAAAERSQDNVAGLHAAEFERLLAVSIMTDKDHHCPATLGVDHGQDVGDPSGDRVSGDIYWNGGGGISDWI